MIHAWGMAAMNDRPEHVRKNRAKWDDLAKEYAAAGERGWVRDTPVWGIWHVPEAELHMLSDDLNGKDAIELGCRQLSEFIYEQPALPDVEYSFKHALTLEVAYNSVLTERRRALHDRIGAAIESIYAGRLDDHLAELTHQY